MALFGGRRSATGARLALMIALGAVLAAPTLLGADSAALLLAAGDISDCDNRGDSATAKLLDVHRGTIVTLGDNVYLSGTAREYARCYDPTWGRHKARTRPVPGNHDYRTSQAAGYFGYFGTAAGDPTKGYYSYDLGSWHFVALNSNCVEVGGCEAGSPQEEWLRADLAAHPVRCTLAYWHHARYSSGTVHGSNDDTQALWQALYDHGADVVLAGHEHNYERFAALNPRGELDAARGIRSFVVGTGGTGHHPFGSPLPTSRSRNSNTYGVLKLRLGADGYAWRFLHEAGKTFSDDGSARCH